MTRLLGSALHLHAQCTKRKAPNSAHLVKNPPEKSASYVETSCDIMTTTISTKYAQLKIVDLLVLDTEAELVMNLHQNAAATG